MENWKKYYSEIKELYKIFAIPGFSLITTFKTLSHT